MARSGSSGRGTAVSQVSDLSEFRNSKSRHCDGEGGGGARGESASGGGGSCRRPREEWKERERRREGGREGGLLKAPSFVLPPPSLRSLSLSLAL